MEADRRLDWPGAGNVRDLGGLATVDGRETVRGACIRADSLEQLTTEGWDALLADGVRTVIDLRNDDELGTDRCSRPPTVSTVQIPLDVLDDDPFWKDWIDGPQFATPLYYRAHLERFPGRSAAVLTAIALAKPGGVAFHCARGRDRTGQIAMLLLALAGVSPVAIGADYMLSECQLRAFAGPGIEQEGRRLREFLQARGTTAEQLIIATLEAIDVEALMRAGGMSDAYMAAVRARLLAPAR